MFYISAKYYQENKGRLKKRPVKDIKILLIKKKIKPQDGPKCYKNILEDKKQKLVEYRNKCYRIRLYYNYKKAF